MRGLTRRYAPTKPRVMTGQYGLPLRVRPSLTKIYPKYEEVLARIKTHLSIAYTNVN